MPTEKIHGFQIAKTAEAFQRRGHDVRLLIPRRKSDIKESVSEYYGVDKIKLSYVPNYFSIIDGVAGLYFPLQRVFFDISAVIRALFAGADCIYSREIVVCFLLSLFNKNVVFEDHEPKNSFKFLYKCFLKKIKKKIVVAYNLVKLYNGYGINEKSYIVAPNGVDLQEFDRVQRDINIWAREFGIDHEQKIALYVGHFYGWKGVYTAIDSAKHLSAEISLVLIGGTKADYRAVEEYIEKNNIENVALRNFMPHHEIIKYIKSADFLLLPNTAQEERSAKYTTPIKLFEYMASGVPIIASRVKSFEAYLQDGENAILFEPDNAKDLAEKIEGLLRDKELAQKILLRAYWGAKDYSWERRVEKIIGFIKL